MVPVEETLQISLCGHANFRGHYPLGFIPNLDKLSGIINLNIIKVFHAREIIGVNHAITMGYCHPKRGKDGSHVVQWV